MEYYSAIEKEGNLAICDIIDGSWGQYAKWNVRQKRQIHYDFICGILKHK